MKTPICSGHCGWSFCAIWHAFLMDTTSYRHSWPEPEVHSNGCLRYHPLLLTTPCSRILALERDCLGSNLDAVPE